LPALSDALGVFIPLIVVNCIIIGRAEAFSSKQGIKESLLDGVFQGLGYTMVLVAMCLIRELLGSGTIGGGLLNGADSFITLDGTGAGIRIFSQDYAAGALVLPFGGFLTLGMLLALMQHLLNKSAEKKAAKEKEVKE
jgi:electron transport complex protein RnfE